MSDKHLVSGNYAHDLMMGLYCFLILASCHTDELFRHIITAMSDKNLVSGNYAHGLMMGLYCFLILASCHTDELFRHIITAICLNYNSILD